MRSTLAFSLLAVAGFSAAQDQYHIDPDSVPQATRDYWCDQQQSVCPFICLQQPNVTSSDTITNDCDADTLTYSCVCEGNITPNLTEYTQTMPFNICQMWGTQCVKNCNNDNICQDKCRSDHPCGAQKPAKPNATASSTSGLPSQTSAAASTSVPLTGFAGQTDTPNKPGAASTLVNFGASYGVAVTFVSALVGFAFL